MTLDVVNGNNEKVGAVELNDEVFGGRVKTGSDLGSRSCRQNASERRGTHATKNRALVSGGGKKPYKQKGTGRPQVGEIRTPLWRKGGTVFGPQPRSYDYDAAEEGRARRAARGARREAERRRRRSSSTALRGGERRRRRPPSCCSGSARRARRS